MDNPYPMGGVNQNLYQVLTEVPIEKRVHVQGVPGCDRELFSGVSSIFSAELWKCKGYCIEVDVIGFAYSLLQGIIH
ncbi:Zinc finger, FYVE/PHD-type [Artemisia annua]|uniref:Zinc finger, FYVE/PHD-type n=1 Tax=Artemisia annua TaxID=35608 RepID=A0A2U1PW68_ARTAN|nr:Zinc finger, FYVE/PHD-type [Artemisia annua]